MFEPVDIVNWSVTALTVTPQAIWLGIATLGEGFNGSGGLLRFDRVTQITTHLRFPDFAIRMAPFQDKILIASNYGIGIVEGNRVRRFFLDRMSGRYRVVESDAIE